MVVCLKIFNNNLRHLLKVSSKTSYVTLSSGKLHSFETEDNDKTNTQRITIFRAPSNNSSDIKISIEDIISELSTYQNKFPNCPHNCSNVLIPLKTLPSNHQPLLSDSLSHTCVHQSDFEPQKAEILTTPSDHLKTFLLKWKEAAFGLSKFRLTSFVVMSALAGAALAAPTEFASQAFLSHVPLSLVCLTIGTGLTSASANTINQIMEIEYDSQMKRTRFRALVKQLVTPREAIAFAVLSGVGGISMLSLGLNDLVALLGVFNLGLYTCVYTPMKRISQWNTWVGAFVGAIPPLMGWAAVTGGLEAGSLMLAALLYAWQMPHFMALSWNSREDYARAGYVMSSVVDPKKCRGAALRHSIGTLGVCLAGAGCSAATLGPWAGLSLGVCSLPANLALIWYSYKFYKAPEDQTSLAARKLFRLSLLHLPVVISTMLICTHLGTLV